MDAKEHVNKSVEEQLEEMTALATSLYYTLCTLHLTGKCKGADGEHQHSNCLHKKGEMSCSWDGARNRFLGELSDRVRELIKFPSPNPDTVYPKGRYHGD